MHLINYKVYNKQKLINIFIIIIIYIYIFLLIYLIVN